MKYSLYDNKVTQDNTDDCYARPVEVKVNTRGQLVQNLTRSGSILKTTECNAVIDGYWNEIGGFIARGEGYRDEYLTVRLDINGVFTDSNDRFDPSRHTLVVSALLNSSLTALAKSVPLQYEKAVAGAPVIESVYDWGSDTVNEKLTPGDTIEIAGEDLKIYEERGEGVFFMDQSTGVETPGELPRRNEPGGLMLRVPALPSGQYRIEVRNTTRKGKVLRTGVFVQPLTVV
jgi:hypothetical protein